MVAIEFVEPLRNVRPVPVFAASVWPVLRYSCARFLSNPKCVLDSICDQTLLLAFRKLFHTTSYFALFGDV